MEDFKVTYTTSGNSYSIMADGTFAIKNSNLPNDQAVFTCSWLEIEGAINELKFLANLVKE